MPKWSEEEEEEEEEEEGEEFEKSLKIPELIFIIDISNFLRKRQKFVVRALQLRIKYLIAIRFYALTFIFTDFFLGPRNNSQLGNHL